MKIKCPIIQNRGFECGDEFVDSEQLRTHFGGCHSFMDISNTLNSQTFKIHEKIAEISEKHPNMSTQQGWINAHRNLGALQTLKSLLDDKK